MHQKRFFKVSEVAQRYRVTPRSVRSWLKSGQLLGFRMGSRGHWVIGEEELLRFEGNNGIA